MRLFFRHAIAALLFLFLCRLAIQAQDQETEVSLPKAVLLSRLSDGDPIPSSAAFDKMSLLKVIEDDSGRLINRERRGGYR